MNPHAYALPTAPAPSAPEGVSVTVESDLVHLCPFVDEEDRGRVVIGWTCAGGTFELHGLRAYLQGFADVTISHEDIVATIAEHLTNKPGIADVTVTASFYTAGMTVKATA